MTTKSRPLAMLLITAALLGGTASAAVLALTGALGSGGSTNTATTVVQASGGAKATNLDASAVYAGASRGVVDITAKGTSTNQAGPFGGSSQSTATGSGFVVDGSGHIVTAAHVVQGASSIKVAFANGTTRTATVTGRDEATDVAVLKVNPAGLTLHPLKLGSSSALKSGDAVAAIGSPFGYQESISTGIVSGVDRTIDAPNGFTVAHAIQTDAALNPGNSGGPILDASGQVIGIADQIATGGSNSEQGSGVGFAVPIDVVGGELSKLESGQTVKHAFLGVSTTESTGNTGARVASVKAGGPAASGGLRAGDVVTSFDGKKISGSSGLVAAIADRQPGDQVKLTVKRGAGSKTLTVKLGTQPTQPSSTAG
jgi:putative serine protease PepD